MRSTYFKCCARFEEFTQTIENKGINMIWQDLVKAVDVKRFCAPMRNSGAEGRQSAPNQGRRPTSKDFDRRKIFCGQRRLAQKPGARVATMRSGRRMP